MEVFLNGNEEYLKLFIIVIILHMISYISFKVGRVIKLTNKNEVNIFYNPKLIFISFLFISLSLLLAGFSTIMILFSLTNSKITKLDIKDYFIESKCNKKHFDKLKLQLFKGEHLYLKKYQYQYILNIIEKEPMLTTFTCKEITYIEWKKSINQ
jgi:hypothetical protein